MAENQSYTAFHPAAHEGEAKRLLQPTPPTPGTHGPGGPSAYDLAKATVHVGLAIVHEVRELRKAMAPSKP